MTAANWRPSSKLRREWRQAIARRIAARPKRGPSTKIVTCSRCGEDGHNAGNRFWHPSTVVMLPAFRAMLPRCR